MRVQQNYLVLTRKINMSIVINYEGNYNSKS